MATFEYDNNRPRYIFVKKVLSYRIEVFKVVHTVST